MYLWGRTSGSRSVSLHMNPVQTWDPLLTETSETTKETYTPTPSVRYTVIPKMYVFSPQRSPLVVERRTMVDGSPHRLVKTIWDIPLLATRVTEQRSVGLFSSRPSDHPLGYPDKVRWRGWRLRDRRIISKKKIMQTNLIISQRVIVLVNFTISTNLVYHRKLIKEKVMLKNKRDLNKITKYKRFKRYMDSD